MADNTKNKTSNNRNRTTNIVIGAAIFVFAVVAAVVAIVVAGGDSDTSDTTSTTEPSTASEIVVTGDSLELWDGVGDDPAVGMTAPGATDGTTSITPGDGRPKLIVLAAHWCPYCNEELPKIIDAYNNGTLADDFDVTIVTVADAEDRPNYPGDEWLDSLGWEGDSLHDRDTTTLIDAYGVTGLPTLVVVDADGTVTARGVGVVDDTTFAALLGTALTS